MLSENVLPLPLGQKSTNATITALLGQVYFDSANNRAFKLVQADTTLLPSQVVVDVYSSGSPNGHVTTTTTRNDPAAAGVVPTAYTTIASGDNFWLQISGSVTVIPADSLITNTAAQRAMGTATTAGAAQLCNSGTVTAGGFDATANFGYATNSTGASAALSTTTIRCMLQGLIGRNNAG